MLAFGFEELFFFIADPVCSGVEAGCADLGVNKRAFVMRDVDALTGFTQA